MITRKMVDRFEEGIFLDSSLDLLREQRSEVLRLSWLRVM
jgi:hypothetical protein